MMRSYLRPELRFGWVEVLARDTVPERVAACSLTAEFSSASRTWSPAAAEKAAPATKRAANVKATAIRRCRDLGFALSAAGGGAPGSSPPCSSHSSQARPWRSLLIKEFRRGMPFAPLVGRRGRHFDADFLS